MEIRKAKSSDKQKVLNFCKTTFSWGDYIADVWDHWISEGNLLVLSNNDEPIAICHSSFCDEQMWIEGIRVAENFRKKGFAKQLVLESESLAIQADCKFSKMLIAITNKKSLNLAYNLNYKKEEIWDFYSLSPLQIINNTDVMLAKQTEKIYNFISSHASAYVRSWRWLPLTKSNITSLINDKRIVYIENNNTIDACCIFTESEIFEKTIMLTLVHASNPTIKKILSYFQNYAVDNNIEKIQILTKIKSVPKYPSLEKKISFCLMKKEL